MTEPVRIRLAALDMAGTTVADHGLVEAAFLDALETVGIGRDDPDMPERLAYVQRTMGMSKIEVFRALLHDEARAQAAARGFEEAVEAAVHRGDIAPIPGAEQAMADLRAAGVKVCLTTGFSADTQQLIVAKLGWADRVDLVLAPGHGIRGRPYPDLVLTAVLRLAIDDVRQVAVAGDTASDLLAGTRAGASVVAGVLTGAHGRAELEAAPHTHLLDSVADLPPVLVG